jgi:hypothetical protein
VRVSKTGKFGLLDNLPSNILVLVVDTSYETTIVLSVYHSESGSPAFAMDARCQSHVEQLDFGIAGLRRVCVDARAESKETTDQLHSKKTVSHLHKSVDFIERGLLVLTTSQMQNRFSQHFKHTPRICDTRSR